MSLIVGQRASRRLTLTAEHVQKFAEISGDRNPLHFDAAFAARTKFGRLVVQGGLTTGLLIGASGYLGSTCNDRRMDVTGPARKRFNNSVSGSCSGMNKLVVSS